MEKFILQRKDYLFNPSTKTVEVLNDVIPFFVEENLLTITNITASNTIIYAFGCNGVGGDFNGSKIVLDYNTALMKDTDRLQIILHKPIESTNNDYLRAIERNTNNMTELIEVMKTQTELIKQMF